MGFTNLFIKYVSLDTRNAAVKCVSSRNPSITNDYNRMISTLDSLKWSLFREFKATEPAEGYTKEQNDSLDFILTTKMNDTILEQIHRMAPPAHRRLHRPELHLQPDVDGP